MSQAAIRRYIGTECTFVFCSVESRFVAGYENAVTTLTTTGAIGDIGETKNKIEKVSIIAPDGRNVTENYEIKCIDGLLQVIA